MKFPLRFEKLDDVDKLPILAEPLALSDEQQTGLADALLRHLGLRDDSPRFLRDRCEVFACYETTEGTDCFYRCRQEILERRVDDTYRVFRVRQAAS